MTCLRQGFQELRSERNESKVERDKLRAERDWLAGKMKELRQVREVLIR